MNAAVIGSNARASHNGRVMENFITSLFPDITFFNDQLDAVYRDIPVEVKSCQVTITDHGTSNSRRSGRFCFEGEQHKALLKAKGEYFFVVHEGCVPMAFFRVSAETLGLPEFVGVKSVSWRMIARKVI